MEYEKGQPCKGSKQKNVECRQVFHSRILNKYDNKLALSQYKREERKEVIESGVRAYERRVKRAEVNG